MNRRIFLEKMALISSSCIMMPSVDFSKENFWKSIKQDFTVSQSNAPFLNLNSGSAGVMPRPVFQAVKELHEFMNSMPPYQALSIWTDERKKVKNDLAQMLKCDASELAFQRNTTSALNFIINGIPLDKDDNIIACTTDYPFALNSLKNRCKKSGATLKLIEHDHVVPEEIIIEAYRNAIDSNTKYIHITHVKHNSGRIIPVKQITKLAHQHGIKVIVDGAHSFGHFDYNLEDLQCDYWATSLHKWLMAPHGTGLLYIKKELIEETEGALSAYDNVVDKMDKFEQIGTHDYYNETGIQFALAYHNKLGFKKKEKRLLHLHAYLRNQLEDIDNILFYTPFKKGQYCGICSFYIPSINHKATVKKLKIENKIIIKNSGYNNRPLFRVSPNIFTLESDIDRFVTCLKSHL